MSAPITTIGDQLDDEKAEKIGAILVELLCLTPARDNDKNRYSPDRYSTDWGDKSAKGLARTIAAIFDQQL